MNFVLKPVKVKTGGDACSKYHLCVRSGRDEERVALISGVRWRAGGKRTWSVSMTGFHHHETHGSLREAIADAERTFGRWSAGRNVS